MQPDALGSDQDALGTLMMQNPELLMQLAAMDPAFFEGLPAHAIRPAEVCAPTCPVSCLFHIHPLQHLDCWSERSSRPPVGSWHLARIWLVVQLHSRVCFLCRLLP